MESASSILDLPDNVIPVYNNFCQDMQVVPTIRLRNNLVDFLVSANVTTKATVVVPKN